MKEKKKVYVGLSGGVDSAVSAALLQEKGYEVVGVFIKTWHPDFFPCTESEDRLSAMRVAVRLGIPFTTLDLSDTYRREVAEEMIGEYKKGRTPNPDVLCNKSVKFGGFYDFAVSEGADYIATGHYARTENGLLFTGKDSAKDQSYFLWMVPSSVLSRTLFPLGLLTKGEVRARARALGLPNAARPDSQGICFLGDISMKDFLSHYIELKDGDVLDEKGSVIGRHKGSILYTIGERHGFEISPLSPHEHS
ncbi:MAG TPA: tRNA 2-thiouridine(34) synthase MnmA, partial [Candidatus Paceibacterota bacterium]